jgi:hypothetical protein
MPAARSQRILGLRLAALALLLGWLFLRPVPVRAETPSDSPVIEALPDAPKPQPPEKTANACQVKRAGVAMVSGAAFAATQTVGAGPALASPPGVEDALCTTIVPVVDWYARFIDGPQVRRMSPSQKAWLAFRDVADPFNAFTILASSAITVGANAHSPYGPGMHGFGKYVGVSYAQDMTGEFVGTFLIPSIVHQDPHYHRWPHASLKRRIAHAAYQIVWTHSDNGGQMINYANIVGWAIEDEIGNLYVPGQKTNLPSSAIRYGTAFATAPIDNYITEFLPDIARRIHTRVVLIQRIINQVAKTGPAPGQ